MSLADRTMKVTYVAAGGTTFAMPDVPIIDDSAEVKVYTRDETTSPATVALQTEGALNDYTLTGAPDANSFHTNVEFNSAPTTGFKVVIHLELPLTQVLNYNGNNSAGVRPTQLEEALDRAVGMVQQHEEQLTRVPLMGITEQRTAAQMVLPDPIASTATFWGWDITGAVKAYTASELDVLIAGFADTDGLPEGSTNLYYTEARVDANSSVVANTAKVSFPEAPEDGSTYARKDAGWVLAGGGGGGALLGHLGEPGPLETINNGWDTLDFIAGETQFWVINYKVPSSYAAGNQINLKIAFFCAASSGTVLISAVTQLFELGDSMVAATDSHTGTNTAITQDVANEYEIVTIDLTDGSGEINTNPVAAGDLLQITINRGTDTATEVVSAIRNSPEVTLV